MFVFKEVLKGACIGALAIGALICIVKILRVIETLIF